MSQAALAGHRVGRCSYPPLDGVVADVFEALLSQGLQGMGCPPLVVMGEDQTDVDIERPSGRFRHLLRIWKGHRSFRLAGRAVGMSRHVARHRIEAYFEETWAMDAPQRERAWTRSGWRT